MYVLSMVVYVYTFMYMYNNNTLGVVLGNGFVRKRVQLITLRKTEGPMVKCCCLEL